MSFSQRFLRDPSRSYALGAYLVVVAALAGCGADGEDPGNAQIQNQSVTTAVKQETPLTPVASFSSDIKASVANVSLSQDGTGSVPSTTFDYGKSVAISRVSIAWQTAPAARYVLQVSEDGNQWTDLKAVSHSNGSSEDIAGLSGQGRYLRVLGIGAPSSLADSAIKIQAFSAPETSAAAMTMRVTSIRSDAPSVVVHPIAATSSAVENNGETAAMAIDGEMTTRWSSARDDAAWIQFDFGTQTQIGYMKLNWESAYGAEYALQASNDGLTWNQLRYVSSGNGGTEEFYNLNANARYIRLQGIARATTFGYSLYEVQFKTPGVDNTLPAYSTSALKFPSNSNGLAPLPAAPQPSEWLQFSLPDGTLVTRYGARAMGRHGRERGEAWNEIGYGPNETVNPVTGQPQDKGPGHYLPYVPEYFQNRTWGVEIIDNSLVKGVTKPSLIINNYNQVDFLPGQTVFVRRWDNPQITGYGWMTGPVLADNNVSICKPMPYPADGVLTAPNGINNGCTIKFLDYPGHGELDAAGFPTGRSVPARPLVPGDQIEIATSMFTTVAALAAKGDKGNIRYYGPEVMYVMGQGIRPWYGVAPRLNSTPLPDSTLSGGMTSVSYNYSDNGLFMFQQPANNVGMQDIQRFVEGRRVVHANFTTGAHNEPGNDPYLPVANLQGQHFNQSACIGCHVNAGRSPAAWSINQKLDTMGIRVATFNANGDQVPHPQYGTAVQMNGLGAAGSTSNWGTSVRLGSFQTQTAKLVDGTPVELRKPIPSFEGPTPAIYSLRAAQPMIGIGLLEAISEADILANARSVPDTDGVKGVPNFVFDPETGAVRLGRFGWKASKATLRQQAAEALLLDMGVTSPVYPNRSCMYGPDSCAAGGNQTGISDADLKRISSYLALAAVPAQRSLASGFPVGVAPLDEHRVDPVAVTNGARVFESIRCTACHTAEMKTGAGHLFAELRNQTIHPYTDLLLHDMGDGLADKFNEGQAKGSMWRTAPLWGIGYTAKVMGDGGGVGFLHDGRARDLTEAIMWHGGEATTAKNRFASLTAADRSALLAFLNSL